MIRLLSCKERDGNHRGAIAKSVDFIANQVMSSIETIVVVERLSPEQSPASKVTLKKFSLASALLIAVKAMRYALATDVPQP
ncbi:hypothetical protein AB1L88_25105 [Tautonia sp. JC769]|uniref:hypothetical protein n=1 Tax=Tautonia sp. JC769 TaxID=3232135 RepID=UPI003457D942